MLLSHPSIFLAIVAKFDLILCNYPQKEVLQYGTLPYLTKVLYNHPQKKFFNVKLSDL